MEAVSLLSRERCSFRIIGSLDTYRKKSTTAWRQVHGRVSFLQPTQQAVRDAKTVFKPAYAIRTSESYFLKLHRKGKTDRMSFP